VVVVESSLDAALASPLRPIAPPTTDPRRKAPTPILRVGVMMLCFLVDGSPFEPVQ
jgi:hypothetical protein